MLGKGIRLPPHADKTNVRSAPPDGLPFPLKAHLFAAYNRSALRRLMPPCTPMASSFSAPASYEQISSPETATAEESETTGEFHAHPHSGTMDRPRPLARPTLTLSPLTDPFGDMRFLRPLPPSHLRA